MFTATANGHFCQPKEKPGTWPGQMVKKAATQSSPRQSWQRQEKSAELSTVSVDKIKARWANQAGFRRNFDYEEIVPKYSGVFKAINTYAAFLSILWLTRSAPHVEHVFHPFWAGGDSPSEKLAATSNRREELLAATNPQPFIGLLRQAQPTRLATAELQGSFLVLDACPKR